LAEERRLAEFSAGADLPPPDVNDVVTYECRKFLFHFPPAHNFRARRHVTRSRAAARAGMRRRDATFLRPPSAATITATGLIKI
jgi:hypothetical protein